MIMLQARQSPAYADEDVTSSPLPPLLDFHPCQLMPLDELSRSKVVYALNAVFVLVQRFFPFYTSRLDVLDLSGLNRTNELIRPIQLIGQPVRILKLLGHLIAHIRDADTLQIHHRSPLTAAVLPVVILKVAVSDNDVFHEDVLDAGSKVVSFMPFANVLGDETHRESRVAESAVLEGHIQHDAVVYVEHAHTAILEVDGEEVSISQIDRVGDVQRSTITECEGWLLN